MDLQAIGIFEYRSLLNTNETKYPKGKDLEDSQVVDFVMEKLSSMQR